MNGLSISKENKIRCPKQDEFEIILFGKGIGECILLHIKDNYWIVVDSFLDPASKRPVALKYLESLGLKPSEVIKQIVVTHWHDDHIRGISEILNECPVADFVCSIAIQEREFFKLVALQAQNRTISDGPGAKEFSNIFSLLKKVNSFPKWAIVDRPLTPQAPKIPGVKILCLSPSDKECSTFVAKIASIVSDIKYKNAQEKILYNKSENTAIVLWIDVEDFRVLLGADLEVTRDPDSGWDGVFRSPGLPKEKAKVYKVAHHGSKNAHKDAIWDELLEEQPYALLTPFTRSNLPRKADVDRILHLTENGFSASQKGSPVPVKRSPAVERTMREVTKSKRIIENRLGAIQINFNYKTKALTHTLLGVATPLSKYPV